MLDVLLQLLETLERIILIRGSGSSLLYAWHICMCMCADAELIVSCLLWLF